MEAVRLRFVTPVHIGSGRDDLENAGIIFHSDALKSALYAVGLQLFPEWGNPSRFFDSFRISSCYPYADQELFLPRPLSGFYLAFSDISEDRAPKKAKKIQFIALSLIDKWTRNPDTPVDVSAKQLSNDGQFLFSESGRARQVFIMNEQQRVKVGKFEVEVGEDSKTVPFLIDRVHFFDGCGLYFLLDCPDKSLRAQLFIALRLLGEAGIGTDRAVGNGFFEFDEVHDVSTVDLPGTGKFSKQIPLGLYLPRREEITSINLDESAWQLIKRGGYIAGTTDERFRSWRKNSIFFFAEGSVLSGPIRLLGKYTDLRPHGNDESLHPVWRDGQPIFMHV